MYISFIILAVGLIGVIIGMLIEAAIENRPTSEGEPPVEDTVEIIELGKDHIEQPGRPVITPTDDYFKPF